PGGIGRELVAAAILELVDGFHQPDVAFLNEVQELQAAVGVLLGNRDNETQIGLDHLSLCLGCLTLATLYGRDDTAEFRNRQPRTLRNLRDFGTDLGNFFAILRDEVTPR